MASTAAEIVRTLVAGRRPGMLAVSGLLDGCVPVVHGTDENGQILIAAEREGQAWLALNSVGDEGAAVLSVVDVPPLPDSPTLGVVWVAGWVNRLSPVEAQLCTLDFAASNPVDLLLDVGLGTDLFRLVPAEIRLERSRSTVDVDPDEYAAARPDPFHVDERDLLLDLRHHHTAEIAALVGVRDGDAQVVRLNRHGVIVRVRGELRGYEFRQPARDTCCVARALHLGHERPAAS